MDWVEYRPGIVLYDPLHQILPPPVDLSYPIFFFIYFTVFASIFQTGREDLTRLSFALIGYGTMTFLRGLCIILVPLNPPPDMIQLNDPIVAFFSTQEVVFTKDLFFSGHTATMVYLTLLARVPWLKKTFRVLTVLVVAGILLQRVHYTIDIIGGVFAGWTVHFLMDKMYARYADFVKVLPEKAKSKSRA